MTSTNLLYIYVIIINVVTFFIYGLDKSRAKAGQWRIPEAQLIFLAVIGGSVGALAGMKVFHHKTRKPKFKTGVPAILIIQLIIYFLFSGNEGIWILRIHFGRFSSIFSSGISISAHLAGTSASSTISTPLSTAA